MGLDVTPLKQTNLGEQVARELRVLIVDGRLVSGVHLIEADLSRDFGVSRGPIRDALRKLEAEGLVETRQRGTFVVGLTEQDVAEMFSLRQTLESFALRLCADRDDLDWGAFEDPLARMRAAADVSDAATFALADLQFHALFYELSGHRRLNALWRDNEPTFSTLLTLTTARDVDLHPSAESHAEILEYVRAGDLERALRELEVHLEGASRRLREARREASVEAP
ncbi:GntR family transcriptional regulator [Ruania halotolerans]|uniref:GntR family transcriptional regulator n=1 Tax=Ruania halotolerans TaxID=2897773 RepID=UPI001E2EBA83|nr:GntR family transcriptional regulator [Ruania halotolerans]UFU06069.1 GntR family transcriptional regulator [Ruania halotolerans]